MRWRASRRRRWRTSVGSAPFDPHPVLDLDLALGRDLHLEGEGVGIELLRRMTRLDDFPVAADRLEDFDRLDAVLVVAQRDLPRALGVAGAERRPVHLLAIADDVERVAHLDPDLLVARRMVDP